MQRTKSKTYKEIVFYMLERQMTDKSPTNLKDGHAQAHTQQKIIETRRTLEKLLNHKVYGR